MFWEWFTCAILTYGQQHVQGRTRYHSSSLLLFAAEISQFFSQTLAAELLPIVLSIGVYSGQLSVFVNLVIFEWLDVVWHVDAIVHPPLSIDAMLGAAPFAGPPRPKNPPIYVIREPTPAKLPLAFRFMKSSPPMKAPPPMASNVI